MKQSQNQTETIQVLYELALSIGSSLDLPQMLAVSMQAFAEKLGCVVSTVYRCQTAQTAWQFEAVATNTHAVDKTDTAQMALAMLPNSAAAPTVAQCMATLPLVGPGADGDYYHLLELPGFGALLLIKDEAPLDEGMVEALRPLQEKLAAAANACIAAENSPHAEEESQTILESITTPLLISRISDGLILYANDLLAQMIGTTTEQLIGNITPDFYANTDDRKTLLTKLQAQGILTNYELQIKRSNGELIWVLLSIKPFNYQGEPALIATFLEITERKQTLQQLRESRERARAILESVTLPLIISRLEDGAVLYANDRVAEMMGMTTEEIIGHRTPDFYRNPEDRTKIVQGALTQGGVDNVELPISRNGEPRWALISNRLTEYDDQRAIITTLVDITDRKLAEETQVKRAAELETVARVSASTARILETDKLLQEVVDLTKERFGLYHAHIYLLNKAGDTLVLTAGAGEIGQKMVTEKRSIPLSQEQSLVAQAARTRQGVIENDVLNNPAFLPHPLLPNTRAEMAVPVLIGDRVIGVLDTQADQVGWFTQQDILIKTTLAAQVAVALENARSFESARTSLAETEALLDITKESSRTLELQVIMESVLDRVLAATKFEAGLISLENPTTQTLELFSHRLPGQFLQALQKNGLDNTLCDMVYRQQKSIVVVNLNDDAPVDVSGLIRLGFQSYQGVPIAAKGDVFGTICLFSNHLLSSDEANTVFLQAVGQQVGIAIQNANLLKQTQVALAEVEQSREVVQEYLDMQRVLHEINTELLQVDDLDGLYYRAIELAHTRLGFERIGMYLLNEAKDTLLGTYGVDTNGEVRTEQGPEHVITDPQTIQTYILNRTRLTVAEDIDLLQENTVVGHGWHMGAAMWAEEAPIGVIFADNLVTGQPLKPYQSELLFAYARTVASLIVRRRSEAMIRERETLLRTIIDSTPDWIFVKDRDHRYELVNQGYANSMHMEPDAFIGKNDLDIGFPEEIVRGNPKKGIRGFWADDNEIMDSGERKIIDEEPAVVEGEARTLHTIKVPLHDANGEVTGLVGFVHDITKQKATEEALRESESRSRNILNSANEIIFTLSMEGVLTYLSPAWTDVLGFSIEEGENKPISDFVHPEDISGAFAFMERIMTTGESQRGLTYRIRHKDGSWRWFRANGSAATDEDGNFLYFVGLAQDFTEQKTAEEALQAAKEYTETILHSITVPILISQVKSGEIRYANEHLAEMVGMPLDELIGNATPNFYVRDEDRTAVVGTIRAEGSVANYQLQLRRANGETFWGLLTARLIQFEDETAIMTSLIDITDRKAAEERVRANEELMRTIIDSTPDWIFVKDHDHRYRLVNQGYADSMHMAPEEFIGKNDLDIGFPEEIVIGNPDKGIRGFWADDNEIMASGERKIIDEEPAVVDGEARVLHTVKVPLHDTEGEVAGLVGFVHDITNRKQIEVTLHQSEEKFRSLFEQSADAYLILEDNLFVDCNQATVDLLRASSKEEVLSLHPSQFSPERQPDGRFSGEKADEMIETAVKQGNHRFEWIHRRVDGEDFFAEVLLTPISMGGQDAVFAVIRDVTDRQQAQATIAKRAAEMQAVADVGRTAATILDTRELLQEVVDLSKSNFDLYHAHIYLLDAEAETLLLTSGSGEIGRQMVAEGRQIPLMQEQSLVARAARLRQGVVINDVQAEPGFLPHPMLPDTRAEMAVPLIAGEQVLGVLDVQSDQSHQFTQEDISVFTTLAAQTAVALQNARLFTQSEERARELSFVNRIVTEINTLDTKNGLNFLAKELGEALQTPSVVVGLIDGSGTMLELVAALHPAEAPSPVGAVFPVDGDPIMGQAIQTRQTVVIENVANFNLEAETKEEILRTGTRSMYVIPMIVGRDLIGTVSVNILQGSSLLTPDQLEMAETTVYQAATAVQNARLFEQAQAAFNNVERSQAELSQALEIAKLAYWEYDVEQDLFTFNDQFYAIFHTTAEAHGGYQLSSGYYAQNFVHPDDTPMVGSEIGVALSSTDRHYTRLLEHRILYADGGIGYISVNVTLERDEHGKITRFYGANQDITNRKLAEEVLRRSEAELSQALAIAKLGYWEYDVAQDLFTFNDQFYSLFHTTAEAHGGYRISSGYYAQTFVHPDDVPMVGSEIGRALGSTERRYTRLLEHRILYADGGIGYISVNVTLERDEQGNIVRFYGANQDITDRKLVEQAVAKQAQELQIVAELSTTVATTLEQEKLLQEVVDLTKERFEFYHAQIYLLNMQQNRLALAFGAGEVGHTLVAQKHQIALDAPQSLVAQAARSGQAVVVNDVRENPDWLPNKLLPETQAEMAVPLMVGDRVVGVLDVQSERLNRFTDQDVQIQTTLAAQVSIALENARSFEQAQTAVAEMNALARRLTHEGWDDYFDNVREEKLSFLFDGMSVQEAEEASFNATLQEDEKELLERAIEVRGVKIGKMAIVAEEEDPELEEVVNSVMQQLASHIENLRLTEQVQTSLAQTEALYTGSERIVLSSTEADVLESLIYSTQLRHLDRANIFLFDQPVEDNVARDVTAVAVWEHEGVPHTVDVGTRFTVAQVPFMSMITAEASMVVEDIRQDPRVDDSTRQILESYGMISFVLFPMVVGSQWLGMVSGQSARPVYMSDVQRRQASSLVSQASVVLQTTILFRQEQARARREQMLRAIAAKVRSSTDVDSIMRTAVTEIGRTLGRRAFIKLSDGQLMDTAEENGVAL